MLVIEYLSDCTKTLIEEFIHGKPMRLTLSVDKSQDPNMFVHFHS